MDETVMSRLTDVTFVIPVRVDSPERARNLDIMIDFFIRHFYSNILVLEADSHQRYFPKTDNCRVQYFFEEDRHSVFQRTLYLNHLYRKVDTPITACWDTDFLITPQQIINTVAQIRNGNAVMGIVYDGHAYQISNELVGLYQETQDFDVLFQKAGELKTMYGDLSVGGAFIFDTKKYLQAGGENEFFLGWGPEDIERVKRMEILYSQPVYRAKGCAFHLWHPRYINSGYADMQYEINGKKEYLKVCEMTADELQDYIKSWRWLKSLHTHEVDKL